MTVLLCLRWKLQKDAGGVDNIMAVGGWGAGAAALLEQMLVSYEVSITSHNVP